MAYFGDYSWNIELRPEEIQLLPKFHGFSCDNPYLHIQKFEEVCATLSNLKIEAVKIKFFERSLHYKATGWFFSLNLTCIRTWQEVKKRFLEDFSPAYEIVLRKQEIVNFAQTEEESYLQSWERYKDLLLSFPNHGFELWRIIEYFYEGLNSETRQLVDMMCHGEFLDKTTEKGWCYYDQFAKESQFWVCNMKFEDVNSHARVEDQIEPLVVNEGVGFGLEKVLELDWNDNLNVQCSPQKNFTWDDALLDIKTLEEFLPISVESPLEHVNQILPALDDTNPLIESPPIQDFNRIEVIDFLGVDDFDLTYHPCLVDIVNNMKINFVRLA